MKSGLKQIHMFKITNFADSWISSVFFFSFDNIRSPLFCARERRNLCYKNRVKRFAFIQPAITLYLKEHKLDYRNL